MPKFWHSSSSAEAAAAADDVNIVNAFVTVLFIGGMSGCVVSLLSLIDAEGLISG